MTGSCQIYFNKLQKGVCFHVPVFFFYTDLFNILSILYIIMKNRYHLNKCISSYLQRTCKI